MEVALSPLIGPNHLLDTDREGNGVTEGLAAPLDGLPRVCLIVDAAAVLMDSRPSSVVWSEGKKSDYNYFRKAK